MTISAKKTPLKRKTKRNIFYFAMIFLPMLQFAIFYIYVNFNSIVLAFQNYELNENFLFDVTFTVGNFKTVWDLLVERSYLITNALIKFAVVVIIDYPLALIFSFYIYKKWVGSGFFKTILFMPQLVSGLIYGLLYKYIISDVYIALNPESLGGLLDLNNLSTARTMVIVYNIFMAFGVNVLLFSGSMSGINDSVVESAHLDGANSVQEFIYITVPMIWSTLVQLMVVSISAIFTDQMNLMTFYGSHAEELSTLGYFIYFQTQASDVISPDSVVFLNYSELAALGLMATLVIFPITMITRKLMFKYGPSD